MKILYGIPNCDTVKKAVHFLNVQSVNFSFHNFKIDGLESSILKSWCQQVGWEKLVNKKSATWRGLSSEIQNSITNEDSAISVMLKNSSLIKRPVLVENGKVLCIGFDETGYLNLLN